MRFAGQAREELSDFFFAHLRGMTLVVEEYETFDPMDIGLLGLETVMLKPSYGSNLIE